VGCTAAAAASTSARRTAAAWWLVHHAGDLMPTLDLLPPVAGLSFIEEGHRYEFHDRVLGRLVVPSTSAVLSSTEAKAMNWAHWRGRLMAKGLTEEESQHAGSLWPGPGVPLLEPDADAFMEWWRSYRASIGTSFHLLAECTLLDVAVPDSDAVLPEAEKIHRFWMRDFYPCVQVVRLIELPLIHFAGFYCGTPDLLAQILLPDGTLVWALVDWKTQLPPNGKRSVKVRQEWQLQNGAYYLLLQSCYGIVIDVAINCILWNGGLRLKVWNKADLIEGSNKYLGFLAEYHARQALLGSVPSQIALTALSSLF
jgi:hypothetical protein